MACNACESDAMLEQSSQARVCDVCNQDIKRDIPHQHCTDCEWDCCRDCEHGSVNKLVPVVSSSSSSSSSSTVEVSNVLRAGKKKGKNAGKKKGKKKKKYCSYPGLQGRGGTRGDDEHCGKSIEMPASFWKIKDGTFFKGEIKHTATWDFDGDTMTGYDILWHTGESELIPLKDVQPYL